MAMKVNKQVHDTLVDAGVHVYESASQYQDACDVFRSCVDEARETLTPSEFKAWHVAEFGTGGTKGAEGYCEGSLPHAWRAKGMLAQRGKKKDEESDPSADRLNTWLSACRAILRKFSTSAAFEWRESFSATKLAAQNKKSGSNRAGTGKGKKGKKGTEPGEVYDLAAIKSFAESHLATVVEMVEQIMIARKDTIRAKALHDIRNGLVAAA
jgi:hypothetical protein